METSVLGGVLLLGLSCGGRSGDSASGDEADLAGRSFLLDHAEGFEPVSGTTVRLSFTQNEITFRAGCNTHTGSYRFQAGSLVVTAMGSTEMGCEPELMAQDEWLRGFMANQPGFDLDGNWLVLDRGSAVLTFLDREVADPDRTLTGQPWRIDSLLAGESASSVPGQATLSVTFRGDGTLEVETGCNTGHGEYEASDSLLTFGSMAYTKVGCASPQSSQTETHIKQVFAEGTASYRIEVARLTVERDDGTGITGQAWSND